MRILIDQAAPDMRNKGNNALVEAAARGLLGLWPEASIDAVTLAPNLTRMYYPFLHPVSPDNLLRLGGRSERLQRLLPNALWSLILELREELWHRWPALMPSQIRRALRSRLAARTTGISERVDPSASSKIDPVQSRRDDQALQNALADYDLVVESGGGLLCDSDASLLVGVFAHLEAAIGRGIPTVMVGQGVGPMEDPELRARAKQVLPRLDLIFVRERRVAFPLLASLGVDSNRIVMTGDDAIEMTYDARGPALGHGIGVSLRVARYTQVEADHVAVIRSALHRAAAKQRVPLVAVPISSAPHESDISHIAKLLAGYDKCIVGWRKLDTPLDAIRRTRLCRIMVTGTFHGAVFALAQGIPVVGLARTTEYYNKLAGLSDEFGEGCQVIGLDDAQFAEKLDVAMDKAWSTADALRPDLLEAAVRQIKLRRDAYMRIQALVATRQHSISFTTETVYGSSAATLN